jgi:hypothetical protein
MERLLGDQQRAHQADRRELIELIREQNDRIMYLAGRQYAPTPLETAVALTEPVEQDDEETIPDPWQLPDDLGDAVWS